MKYQEDTVCMDCGLVANSYINDPITGRNRRSKVREKFTSNYGASTAPVIRHANRKLCENTTLDSNDKNNLLKVWWRTAAITDQTEKNLAIAFSKITKIGDILSLPKSVLEKAATTYKMIAEKHYVKGRNIRALSAATV